MLYAIAGNGVGPNAEVAQGLKDLRDKATTDSVDFWVLIEGKDEPTKIDNVILKWMTDNEVWFEVVTSTGTTYEGAQATEQTEDPYGRMLERVLERRTEDEDGSVLVLLPPEDAEEDEPLMALIENALDSQVEVMQLNGAMAHLSLGEQEEDVPAPTPAPSKAATKKAAAAATKAPAKKAAAPTKAATKKAAAAPEITEPDVADVAEEPGEAVVYTREELTALGVPELTGIARGQGIPTKGLGKRDLIEGILAKTEGVIEVEETVVVASGNGSVPGGQALVVIHTPGAMRTAIVPLVEVERILAL